MKKIIITGGAGFLGTQIIDKLLSLGGYKVVIIDLYPPKEERDNVTFFKKNLTESFDREIDYPELQHPYAVIHLAGKSIYGRFTKIHKQAIWSSRVDGSRHLLELLRRESYRPVSLVAASAVGYYGNQPGEVLTESSHRKDYYFLSNLVRAWEEEVLRGQEYGIHVTCIRNSHIIGSGGVLAEVASMFKMGFGGVLGRGTEYMPWIDVRDLVDLYVTCLVNYRAPSIINGVSTAKDNQRDFSQAIGRVKQTRFYVPIHQWLLKLRFGDFGQEMLVDQYIQSEHYKDISYTPKYTDLAKIVHYYLTNRKK